MYQHILVPTDGSDTAKRGLQEAIELARHLHSRIRVLHIYSVVALITPYSSLAEETLASGLKRNGESILQEAAATVRAAGVEVDQRLVEAFSERIASYVIDEARDWPAQLIVCGTHGHRGLQRLVMGSDAELIVRHSPIPVLLVRPVSEPAEK